ncbi:tRNA (adenosine(37)-N6)-dimethylallyltransferase MiaA [Turicibacter bilis]|uniref:tRNA (adenosine(37)-N6)-dimethylallyltransferase MiaA n=1 Tax=Turicibacter bilis TaxID=2735723 RepID=UPI001BAE8F78|nr:tRNA (adenosine(37)-N6)-dimethylallyltransferase MiaA [Turicibacter bilis]MBS3202414.1 tRNA (adenosine(37)-N6)-dimethylallyltransferase MiaA [Turicibacter bilis]MDY4815995.1 tRNA (adenosine(37)-N6)-dimethylallyltransferase MiaA [Turicibacter bilis]UUF09979.1 tRNA (adenosine(37)-N6)-dimethylallyltransferase MiaA [Turicibacter bilis]
MDVLCIVGPTAVGKTKMSIELAKQLNGEIISGDSMQIYRGMDIGTAKATMDERQGIPHHLIDEKNPDEPYSVAAFQQTVRAKMEEIKSRGKLPIIVGGTGLYIKSVLYDYEFAGESESKEVDEAKYGHLSNEELHAKLATVDEAGAKDIHPNNRKRVIRALEIYETSGVKKSEMIEKQEHKMIYDACLIGLTDDRTVLYDRINKRVDVMYETGLVEEVKALFDQGIPAESQSIRAIGYKELYDYFKGFISLEESKELIKRNSRRYAKRQYTWFNNQMDVTWFKVDVQHFDKTVKEVLTYVQNK